MSARWLTAMVSMALLAVAAGWFGRGWMRPNAPAGGTQQHRVKDQGPCPGGAEPVYWKALMDPTYVRDEPGKSPMGMDLVPVCPGQEASVGGGIRIDPALVQSIGVRIASIGRRDLARKVRTVGRVAYDERLVKHVHTKIQGWVERLLVEYEGELVRRGQPLLEIYSPELVSTQEELLLAARYRDATRESPFSDVAHGGEDLFRATRRRLELWDISNRDIDRLLETGEVRKTLTLYAPTEGVVTHMMVREGMEVGPNDNMYTIADLSRVWLYADVYEYELPWVRVSQHGSVDLSYLPGATFEGEVTYVYPFLDPKTRTARVRLELENPELILKPDMFANVTIETETRSQVLAVPEEAVIRSGRRTLAVVALGEGRFEPREIGIGIDSGDGWIEVRTGLAEGERVVTSGQFLIDSESKLQEAVQKMLGAKHEGAEGHGGHAMPPAPEPAVDHDAASQAGHAEVPSASGPAASEAHVPDQATGGPESESTSHSMEEHSMEGHSIEGHSMEGHSMDASPKSGPEAREQE